MKTLLSFSLAFLLAGCTQSGGGSGTGFQTNSAIVTSLYPTQVVNDGATYYWRLGESTGTTLTDLVAGNNAVIQGGYSLGQGGALTATSDTAISFDGSSGYACSAVTSNNPQVFSIEIWFNTTTTAGGKLIGMGDKTTGLSANYDRHIYMLNSGQVTFGVWPGSLQVVTSPSSYNDGIWHHVVATMGSGGMALYIDGAVVGTNANTVAQSYAGYWRIGEDNLNGWYLPPTSTYFGGKLDEAAVYINTVLSAAQVLNHYKLGVGH